MGKPGKREFVQVLRLMEAFRVEEVTAAVRDAIARGAVRLGQIGIDRHVEVGRAPLDAAQHQVLHGIEAER